MSALARLALLASAVLSLRAQISPEAAAAAHAGAAQEAERRNDFPTAVREYQQVAKLFPQNAEVQSNLGVALYFNHELPRAIAVFQKAIVLKPDLLTPHLFSGLAWYRVSNPDAAVPELTKAVRIDPSDVLSRTWLGYAYVAQFRYDRALTEFHAASQLDPKNVDAWYALGQTYLEIGKDATKRLIAAAPDGGRVWQLAGEQAELQSDPKKALEDYQGALERRPDLAELGSAVARLKGNVAVGKHSEPSKAAREDELYQRAHEAEQQARAAFERVIQLAPDSYRAQQILADSHTAEGRLDEANAEYRAVLTAKPDLPGVHQAIGMNLLRSGKPAKAFTEFQVEIALEPHSATAHTRAGQALLLLGKDEEALSVLNSARQMDRPPADLYRLLGKLDLRRKEYRAAVDALTHYVSLRTDDASAYYMLSKAYAGLGDREPSRRALTVFEKTSRDVRSRNRAQTELARFNHGSDEADEPPDVTHGPGQ